MPRQLVSMLDLEEGLDEVLDLTHEFKTAGIDYGEDFRDRTLAMIFEKSSTRTRLSAQVAMNKMGGQAIFLSPDDLQMGRGETIEDTALVMSRYVDAILYRAFDHDNVEEVAEHARIPVINGLSDREHPCQVVADLYTIRENLDSLAGRSMAYVGDGNNMANSYLIGCALADVELRIATPEGYEPDEAFVDKARDLGGDVEIGHDPDAAVDGVDVVATDTWVSMGDEAEKERRLKDFQGFTIDRARMDRAADDAIFLHCLPAYYGNEVTKEVAHGPQSRILDEAENRMWTQMAILHRLVHVT